MVEIQARFIHDWRELLRGLLIKSEVKGAESLEGQAIEFAYFNMVKRLIEPRPRKVMIAAGLVCPPEYDEGFAELRDKIERGDNLRPHLSTLLMDPEFNDMLLNDWRIHHLHMGRRPKAKKPTFVERTGDVLFVLFTPDTAYLIGIHPHKPEPWAKDELVELLRTNWPALLESYRLKGVTGGPKLTEKERKYIRGKNEDGTSTGKAKVTAPMGHWGDGTFMIGSGYSTSGLAVDVVSTADYFAARIGDAERRFREQVVEVAAANKAVLSDPIVATMTIRDCSIIAFVPGTPGLEANLGPLE